MSLLEQLTQDMVTAMKAKDKETLSVVRMLKAAATNEQISLGHDLTSDDENAVLSREYKQRKESLAEFESAGRTDLVEKTQHELAVVEKYLPEQLTAEEITQIVQAAIEQSGAESMRDMGKVMGIVMPQVKGKADGKLVNETVKAALS